MILCGMCGIAYVQMIDKYVISYYPECKCTEIRDDLLLSQTELEDARKEISQLKSDLEDIGYEMKEQG